MACSEIVPSLNEDVFDKIISVMKDKSPSSLYQYFGSPLVINEDPEDSNIQILRYKELLIDAYLLKKENKLSHLTLFYWKDFDNYTALKKRFGSYTWIEKKVPRNPKSDVFSDIYYVSIPELNMNFEYDNNAPKRKVMWIYFE